MNMVYQQFLRPEAVQSQAEFANLPAKEGLWHFPAPTTHSFWQNSSSKIGPSAAVIPGNPLDQHFLSLGSVWSHKDIR